MAKLKTDDILSFISREFGNPCKFENKEFAKYLNKENVETDNSVNSFEDDWYKVIEISNMLHKKDITYEQYIEGLKMKSEKTPRTKANKVTSEELLEIDCWSNKFYEEAYDIVKDRLFPIVIPSYNRPNCGFLKWVVDKVVPGYEYPIFIVVRQSQKEMYEASEYIKYKDYVHVKAFPDELIDDIGKTREQIVKAFSKQYDYIFMCDDDITNFCHTVPYFRSNGEPKAQGVTTLNFGKTMAMWQIATEYVANKYGVMFTTGMMQGFSWVPDFINVEKSMRLLSGLPTGTVCLNLKKLKELDLNYRTLIGNGHDDLDLLIRGLEKGLINCEFRWMTYSSVAMGTMNFDSIQERFTQQQKEMKDNFGHIEYIKWIHQRGLDNVGINWRKVREQFKNKNIIDLTEKHCYNIWRDGQLLEDAKNNYLNLWK